jgi:hypothetical protein
MPWMESEAMDQREAFVRDAMSQRVTMVTLCARYGVSRRIGYKWLARFAEDGRRGLIDRSRRPHMCPTAMRVPIAELLCEFRRLHPDWGAQTPPRAPRSPSEIEDWPAASTAAELLARRRMICGPPISKGSFAPAMACTAIRSPSPISTRTSCSRVVDSGPQKPCSLARSSSARFASTAFPAQSALTMACPSPRARSMGSRISTSGGCD